MSDHAKKAKNYYDRGLWNKAMLRALAGRGYITAEEYELIVGEPL